MPEHLEEWWAYGAFFLACAVWQGLFGVMILHWPESPAILLAGIVGNLLIVAMYMISRTWGMPLGPDWRLFSPDVAHMENAEMLGMFATAAELGIAFVCVALLDGAYRKPVINVLLFLGIAVWVLRITEVLP